MDASHIGLEPCKVISSNLRPEGYRATVCIEGKEKVIASFDHAIENRLRHKTAWVDQDIIGRKPIELEPEINDLPTAGAEQAMTETEPGGRNRSRNHLVEAQRDQGALPVFLFNQPKRKAGRFLRDEL
jgi:hypothetical protein